MEENTVADIAREVELALKHFEPRLIAETVRVTRDDTLDRSELRIRFVINADLSCNPVNVAVAFIADVEFESSKIIIKRL